MKVCPKCARSFADDLRFCPMDASALIAYDLRADLQSGSKYQFLLEPESLITRLRRELSGAFAECKENPRRFLTGLVRVEGSSRRRRHLLHAGLVGGVIAYSLVFTGLVLLALRQRPVEQTAQRTVEPASHPQPLSFIVPIFDRKIAQAAEAARSSLGFLGGSREQRVRAQGGGGANDATPARNGVPATPTLQAQLRAPSIELPKLPQASLITPETIYADPKSFLKFKGQLGLIGGKGDDASLGEGPGTGIGPGSGPGYGPGKDGNVGGGQNRASGTRTTGIGSDNVPMATARMRPTILYQEKARYTEEARTQRVQGTVRLSAIFGADGRLHNIRVVHGLPAGLTETAIEAAKLIRFNPALENGVPVSVRANLEFNFALY